MRPGPPPFVCRATEVRAGAAVEKVRVAGMHHLRCLRERADPAMRHADRVNPLGCGCLRYYEAAGTCIEILRGRVVGICNAMRFDVWYAPSLAQPRVEGVV